MRISQGVSATGQSLVQDPIARAGARRAWGRVGRHRFATRLAIGTLFDCFCVSVIVGGSSPLKGV